MVRQSFRITGTEQLARLQRELHEAGETTLQRSLDRRLRRATEPLARDLRTTVATVRVWGSKGTGRRSDSPTTRPLRATLASLVRVSVRRTPPRGARVWLDKARLPPGDRTLPAHLDKGRWRKPTFGNRSRWSTQYAEPGWWTDTVRRHEPRIREQAARILDDVEQRLRG